MLALSLKCLMVSLMISSSLGAITSGKPIYDLKEAESHFETFITNYDKKYDSDEEKNMRFEIFKENLNYINRRNMDPHQHAEFGITQFSDLTNEEFIKTYTGLLLPNPKPVDSYHNLTKTVDAPESYDWRQYGKVTRVKQQGTCGACWTFSATGAIESAFAIRHGQQREFSEQQILDCDTQGQGCNGGSVQSAINYVAQVGGQDMEQSYPYENGQGVCRFQPGQVGVKVARMLPYSLSGEEITKQYLVQYGPIAITLAADDFQIYHGGILNCSHNTLDHSHAVLLVGYGNEGGVPYYIIKNSWGTEWGESGYVRINRRMSCGLHNNYAAGVAVA